MFLQKTIGSVMNKKNVPDMNFYDHNYIIIILYKYIFTISTKVSFYDKIKAFFSVHLLLE